MRRTPNGWQSPWIPFEIISSEAPLTGYTVGAAYASFMDTYVGSLSPLFHDHVIESDAQYKYGPINEVIHKAGCQRSFLLEGHGLALCSWCHSISSCSPVCIYRPGNPVPITLQSLAVLALLIVLGSHLGMGAVLLYLLGGTCGLPDGGSSGHHILLTDKSSGYL